MRYLFILDFEHLDKGGFLKQLAKHLAGLKLDSFMMIHADSLYTDRIIQTGMMREDATIRSIKELNHRLTALFADEGIPMIALNAYQRETITEQSDGNLSVNAPYLKMLGTQTNVLVSSLITNTQQLVEPTPLSRLAEALHAQLEFDHIIAFDAEEEELNEIFTPPPASQTDTPDKAKMPNELASSTLPIHLVSLKILSSRSLFDRQLRQDLG